MRTATVGYFLLAVIVLAGTNEYFAQFTYSIDDGFAEGAYGAQNGTTAWGNRFPVDERATEISPKARSVKSLRFLVNSRDS